MKTKRQSKGQTWVDFYPEPAVLVKTINKTTTTRSVSLPEFNTHKPHPLCPHVSLENLDLKLVPLGEFFTAGKAIIAFIFARTTIETVIVTRTGCQTFKIGPSTVRNTNYVFATLNHTSFSILISYSGECIRLAWVWLITFENILWESCLCMNLGKHLHIVLQLLRY